jgi:hypothetical protein
MNKLKNGHHKHLNRSKLDALKPEEHIDPEFHIFRTFAEKLNKKIDENAPIGTKTVCLFI